MNRRESLKAMGLLTVAAQTGHLWAANEATPTIDVPKLGYPQRSPSAPWRKAAADRIEKYRKGKLSLKVTDSSGRPMEGAEVSLRMKRHAFHFGSQVDVRIINDTTEDAARYREQFLKLFNYATLNPFYYQQWRTPKQAQETLAGTLRAIPFFEQHRIKMRGHVLAWNLSPQQKRRTGLDATPAEEVHETVLKHIPRIVGNEKVAAAVDEWDVQNEPTSNSDIYRKLGKEKFPEYFRLTHQLAPQAQLFLNEAKLISQVHDPKTAERLQFIMDLVKWYQSENVPIHGLGCQSHHTEKLTGIDEVLRRLDLLATLGLPLQITEYDIKLVPATTAKTASHADKWRAPSATSPELERLEADYFRDFLTICFSHPAVNAFIMWGFWDGRHWLYNSPIYRKDWSLKPGGSVWNDLVLKEWRTDTDGRTSGAGLFETRAFLGDYTITARRGAQTGTIESRLDRTEAPLTVVLS